jgi:hypothetical protein
MPSFELKSGMQSGSVSGVITRRDGTVEDLGIIAFNHKNPFKVALWEKEKFGKVTEDTAKRCARAAGPYVAAGAAVAVGLGYLLLRK